MLGSYGTYLSRKMQNENICKVSLCSFFLETSCKCFQVNLSPKSKKWHWRQGLPIWFFFWRQVVNVSKLTCLQNPKSGIGDKVSLYGFFWRQVVNVSKLTCLQNQESGNGDKVPCVAFFMETSSKYF